MYLPMTFWTPALAYAGFLLAGGENMPNKMGVMVTTGFMGALLGFLLAIMFTLRGLRRGSRAGHHRPKPKVQAWLKRHPRFISHFVPTSSSWLNLLERWFGELTSKRIRRGSLRSVEDLEKAITEFLAAWNKNPKPFIWTATVESIVQKLSRCRQTLEQIRPGCTLPRRRKAKR